MAFVVGWSLSRFHTFIALFNCWCSGRSFISCTSFNIVHASSVSSHSPCMFSLSIRTFDRYIDIDLFFRRRSMNIEG